VGRSEIHSLASTTPRSNATSGITQGRGSGDTENVKGGGNGGEEKMMMRGRMVLVIKGML
jgi:hypothetical protein